MNVTLSAPSTGVSVADTLRSMGVVVPSAILDRGGEVPSIWVDGRLHMESSRWFRKRVLKVAAKTVRNDGLHLRTWIEFLHRDCGKTVHDADQSDWEAFLQARWLPSTIGAAAKVEATHDDLMTDQQVVQIESTVRRFHRWLERPSSGYGTEFKFDVEERYVKGLISERLEGGPGRKPISGTPVPLHPTFLQALLNEAGVAGSVTYERDMAWLRFLVASGMRRKAATLMTVYEIPPRTTKMVQIASPHAISKTRGYTTQAFPNLMTWVWDYIEGARCDLAQIGASRFCPKTPLHIIKADASEVTFKVNGSTRTTDWNDMHGRDRAQLVDADGSSPLLWLQKDGLPMGYSTGWQRFNAAVKRAQRNTEWFPQRLRPHDLRHTYAMLTVLHWFFANEFVVTTPSGRQIQERAESAMGTAQANLGHANPATTALYTRTAIEWVSGPDPVTPDMIRGLR